MLKNLTQTLNTEYERTVFNTNTQFFYCVASRIESNKYKYLSHVATNSHNSRSANYNQPVLQ